MGIIKFHSNFGNLVGENFMAGGPVCIPPQRLRDFAQAKAKKKCTSDQPKGIWASHSITKNAPFPVNIQESHVTYIHELMQLPYTAK